MSAEAAAFVQRWWRGEAGRTGALLSAALAPAELLFRAGQRAYHGAYAHGLREVERVAAPVASVGNLAVGGAGKTPVTRWMVEELLRRGASPAVLHGGYAADEPALHALWYPGVAVLAGRDRAASARRALAAGADVLVLDDGFQHRRLARDLDVVLLAAERWERRPRLLPRGPWREPPSALARADVIAVTRKTASPEAAAAVLAEARRFAPEAVGAVVAIRAAGWARWDAVRGGDAGARGRGEDCGRGDAETRGRGEDDRIAASAAGRRSGAAAGAAPVGSSDAAVPAGVAVCGIAEPGAFLEQARASGARIDRVLEFGDHQAYDARDAARIAEAAAGGAVLTTAKDAVKLGPLLPGLELWVLEQQVVVEAGTAEMASVLDELAAARRGGLA